jgi:hypothetical protein
MHRFPSEAAHPGAADVGWPDLGPGRLMSTEFRHAESVPVFALDSYRGRECQAPGLPPVTPCETGQGMEVSTALWRMTAPVIIPFWLGRWRS